MASSTQPLSPAEVPWANCVLGCEFPANGTVHLLPCLHVLCSDACLETEESTAPYCCKKCLHKFTPDQIKRNLKLEDFLGKRKTKLEDVVLKCGKCDWDEPATSYCAQCQVYLCKPCNGRHAKFDHQAQVEKNMELRKLIELRRQNQCESHANQDLIFFCLLCDTKICEECKPGHDTHEVLTVEDEMSNIRPTINSAKEVHVRVNQATSKLASLKISEWQKFLDEVDAHLAERKAWLFQEGEKIHAERMSSIEENMKDLCGSSFLLQVNDISENLNLDDTWLIKITRTFALPPSDILINVKNMSEKDFDDYLDQNLVEDCTKPRSSSPKPGPSSMMWIPEPLSSSTIRPSLTVPYILSQEISFLKQEVENGECSSPQPGPGSMITRNPVPPTSCEDSDSVPTVPLEVATPNQEGGDGNNGSSSRVEIPITPPSSGSASSSSSTTSKQVHNSKNGKKRKGTTGTAVNNKRRRLRNQQDSDDDDDLFCIGTQPSAVTDAFMEAAPGGSYNKITGNENTWRERYFPTQTEHGERCCAICVDGGTSLVCDECKRAFHLNCHIPNLPKYPESDKWFCNYHDKPRKVEKREIRSMQDIPASEAQPLTSENPRQFAKACNFMVAVYKIPERPTMQWYFPEKYCEANNGKVPYHLDFLRKKLCALVRTRTVSPAFSCVNEYMIAFRQMFLRAFEIYQGENEYREHAVAYFKKFEELIKVYYPGYQDLFKGILQNKED